MSHLDDWSVALDDAAAHARRHAAPDFPLTRAEAMDAERRLDWARRYEMRDPMAVVRAAEREGGAS